MKRKFSKDFKAKVAVEALKGNQTIRELSIRYQVHPNMISSWKKRLLERIPEIFSEGQKNGLEDQDRKVQQLFQEVGELQYELSWLKKKSGLLG